MTTLPSDIDALKALVLGHGALEPEWKVLNAILSEQFALRAVEIEILKLLIIKLGRMQLGKKTEELNRQINRLELRLEGLQVEEAAAAVY